MEIKILVQLNEKAELENFIETCKEYGMKLTRQGGGSLPKFSGYYAELKGVRWQKTDTGGIQLAIPDVIKSVCGKCLYYLTCMDVNRDKQRCQLYDDEP